MNERRRIAKTLKLNLEELEQRIAPSTLGEGNGNPGNEVSNDASPQPSGGAGPEVPAGANPQP